MTIPTTRKQAIFEGSAYYKTGTSCIRGHDAKRYVAGGACTECRKNDGHKRYGQLKKSRTIQKDQDYKEYHRDLDRQFEAHRKLRDIAVAEDRVYYGRILPEPTPESREHCRRVRTEGAKP